MPTQKKIHSCKPHKPTQNQSLQESIFFFDPRRILPSPSFLKNLFLPTHGLSGNPTMTATNVNRFVDRFVRNPTRHSYRTDRRASGNMGFAIAGVPCFADTFVQGGSSVLRMKFNAKTPRHRKPPKRCEKTF